MGIVAKQSIYNSIASYIGIIIGAVNTIILFPNVFTTDEFGLTRVINAAAVLGSTLFLFGIPSTTLKFFPFFRDKENKHNGILFFILVLPLAGYLLFLLLSLFFKEEIVSYYSDKSSLFRDHYNYILILTLYMVYFTIFDVYLRSLYKTVICNFLQNAVLRFLWTVLIVLYYFNYLDFEEFMFYYVNVFALLILIVVIYTAYIKELFLLPQFQKFDKQRLKEMAIFSIFIILGASSGMLSGTIDSLMVGALLEDGLKNVAFYSIAMYIGIMIMIPYRGIVRVAVSIISEASKENNIERIAQIYKQTSINLMLIGTLLFLGIWLNVDNIFKFLPKEYLEAKYVLLFVCLASLYDVSTGLNAFIIQFSKFFKLMLYFNVLLILLLIGTNFILIPKYGIEGAAFATLISIFIVNTIRLIIIKIKMGIMPFTIKSIYIPIVGAITYLVIYFIPPFESFIIDIVIRSSIICVLFIPSMYFFKVSEEFNALIDKTLRVIKLKK